MPDPANVSLTVAGRQDHTLDVKRYLIARLQQEFKEARELSKELVKTDPAAVEFPLVDVSSAWPTVDANFPCMAVISNEQQQGDQFIGDVMGQDTEGRDLKGWCYHEVYAVYLFSLKAIERDLLSRIVEFILRVSARDLPAIEAAEVPAVSGGSDQQDMDAKGRVQYMTVWALSLANPHFDGPAAESEEDVQSRVTHVDVEGEFE